MSDDGEGSLRNKINSLRLAIAAQAYAIVLQILVLISVVIIPVLTIGILALVEFLVKPSPIVTFSPFGIVIAATEEVNGVRITRIVMAAAASIAGKRLYYANTNGYPTVDVRPSTQTDD